MKKSWDNPEFRYVEIIKKKDNEISKLRKNILKLRKRIKKHNV